MTKFFVDVTFTFMDIEAESEDEARDIVDSCFTTYVRHPVSDSNISPDVFVYEDMSIK
jgi:hypothetical protein